MEKSKQKMHNKAAIIIMDGWGHGQNPEVSAIAKAHTPFVDSLYDEYPNAELVTYGEKVGLPEGQMGNSEVGHLNIGAGRIVYQELARINKAFADQAFQKNKIYRELISYAKEHDRPIHLLGLVSDGGVHSHINHLLSLCDLLRSEGVKAYIHAFLDGRDTDPHGGINYLKTVEDRIKGSNIHLATVVGRYYAMDRDHRWERIEKAYDVMVKGEGILTDDVLATIQEQYDDRNSDEFMPGIVVNEDGLIKEGDAVLFFNFRTDRPREITAALSQKDFPKHDMNSLNLHYVTMTNYDDSFKNIHVIFEKDNIEKTIGEVVSNEGLSQLHIAETEKYPHVTYFLNGGREAPYNHEDRIMVSSPKVPTYDMKPEMSAYEVTEKLIDHVKKNEPDFICLNYANTDMVGHTGVFSAAVTAAETVDICLKTVVDLLLHKEYEIFIIADHGNSDIMINPDRSPHTAHTTNPVPIFYLSNHAQDYKIRDGKLADVAVTALTAMGIAIPSLMTGDNLLTKKN